MTRKGQNKHTQTHVHIHENTHMDLHTPRHTHTHTHTHMHRHTHERECILWSIGLGLEGLGSLPLFAWGVTWWRAFRADRARGSDTDLGHVCSVVAWLCPARSQAHAYTYARVHICWEPQSQKHAKTRAWIRTHRQRTSVRISWRAAQKCMTRLGRHTAAPVKNDTQTC